MKKFIFYLYIVLLAIYLLQGTLYDYGSRLSQGSLLLEMAISSVLFIIVNFRYKLPVPMRLLSLLVVIWTFYGLVNIVSGSANTIVSVPSFTYLKNIYLSLLPIYAFYYFAKNGLLFEENIRKLFFLFLFLAIAGFFSNQSMVLSRAAERGLSIEEITNNAGYSFVALLPLLPLYWRKPLWQFILLAVCMLFVLMGMKRGAIFSGVICSIWMIVQTLKGNEKRTGEGVRRRFARVFLTILIVVGAVYAIRFMLQTSDYFNERVQATLEGDASGREHMYRVFMSWFFEQNRLRPFLFGNGADATLRLFSIYAHNDWLEIAINNGIVVVLIYAAYWLSLFLLFRKCRPENPISLMIGMFIIVFFLATLFSMSYNSIPPYSACAFAYAMANFEYRQSMIKRSGGRMFGR